MDLESCWIGTCKWGIKFKVWDKCDGKLEHLYIISPGRSNFWKMEILLQQQMWQWILASLLTSDRETDVITKFVAQENGSYTLITTISIISGPVLRFYDARPINWQALPTFYQHCNTSASHKNSTPIQHKISLSTLIVQFPMW